MSKQNIATRFSLLGYKPISCHCMGEKNNQVSLASANIKKVKGATHRTVEEALAVCIGHFSAKTFRVRLRLLSFVAER